MMKTQIDFKSMGEILSASLYNDTTAVAVVLCPPHPLFGGSKNDTRIVRIAKELASHDMSALCIDYGSYGQGVRETQNVLDAIRFLRRKKSRIGLLGYSFGAVVASNAAMQAEIVGFTAISILKEIDGLKANLNFPCSKLFIHGKHDTVSPYSEFKDLYREVKGKKEKLILNTDHFYMEKYPEIINETSRRIRIFFQEQLFS